MRFITAEEIPENIIYIESHQTITGKIYLSHLPNIDIGEKLEIELYNEQGLLLFKGILYIIGISVERSIDGDAIMNIEVRNESHYVRNAMKVE